MLRDFPGGLTFGMPHLISGAAFFDSILIDAAGEKAAHVFEVPKSGTVSTVRVRVNAASDPQTLRVGLYTVDTDGLPTTTAYGGSVYGTATPTANSELAVTLGTAATMTRGDRVAVVVEFDSTVGSVNIGRNGNITTLFPYTALYTGSWAKNAGGPIVTLGYSDGSYPPIFGVLPSLSNYSSQTFNVDTSGFDEYGFVWTAPFAGRLRGVVGPIATAAAGADFELIRYTGTTADETVTVDGDHVVSTFNSRPHHILFPTGMRFQRGDVIRVAVRPTTTNGITINHLTVTQSAILEAFFGTDFKLCRRLDQGAWTDEATMAPIIYPLIDQLDDAMPVVTTLEEIAQQIFHPPEMVSTTLSAGSQTLDAAGEKLATVFQIPKSGTIASVTFRLNTVTTGQTLRVGLYTVDANGDPTTTPYSDGAHGTTAVADNNDNQERTLTFGTPYTATQGDLVALVLEFDSTAGVLQIQAATANGREIPYGNNYLTGAWVKTTTCNTFWLTYGDSSNIRPTGIITPFSSSTSYTHNVDTGSIDETGIRFTAPMKLRIRGIAASVSFAAGATFDVVVYDDNTTPLYTWPWDSDQQQSPASTGIVMITFPVSLVLEAGQSIRISFRPTTTTNITTLHLVHTTELSRQLTSPHQHRIVRVDQGAWTDQTNTEMWMWPLVDAIEKSLTMTGTHTISGNVKQGGVNVAGATVRLICGELGVVQSTTTDSNGNYAFSVAGGYVYHAIAEVNVSGTRYHYRSLWDLTPTAP